MPRTPKDPPTPGRVDGNRHGGADTDSRAFIIVCGSGLIGSGDGWAKASTSRTTRSVPGAPALCVDRVTRQNRQARRLRGTSDPLDPLDPLNAHRAAWGGARRRGHRPEDRRRPYRIVADTARRAALGGESHVAGDGSDPRAVGDRARTCAQRPPGTGRREARRHARADQARGRRVRPRPHQPTDAQAARHPPRGPRQTRLRAASTRRCGP